MILKMLFFYILGALSCNFLYGAPIKIDDPLDFCILDRFFRSMMHQSEYGYVLHHSKPISALEISSLEILSAPTAPLFDLNTYSLEAIEVWKRINPSSSAIVLKITEIFDPDSNRMRHELLFINSSKLREAIESNINLFRYVLGPSVETSSLLNHIVTSPEPLDVILKEDRVLVGIVLGFGAYNSLMHSRTETLGNISNNADLLPYSKSCDLLYANLGKLRSLAFFLSIANSSALRFSDLKPITPGFGFTSTKDELTYIHSKSVDLPEALVNKEPRFIFGAYENINWANELKKTQIRIKKDLERSNFLEYILEKITGEKPLITCIPTQNERFVIQGNAEASVAKVLLGTYSQLDTPSEFIEAFCRKDAHVQTSSKLNLIPGALPGLEQAQSNLKLAEEILAECSQKPQVKEIKPEYLYFEQLKTGNGKSIGVADEVLLSYMIEDGQGNFLAAQRNCWIKLSQTIPGFILGVQGMQEGEIRKVYIHPSYGYGISATLPPCSLLKLTVTLHRVNSHSKGSLPSLIPLDLSCLKDPEVNREIEQATVQLARSLGKIWGLWLSMSPHLDFSKLCKELNCLAKSQDPASIQPTIEDQHLCNHIFWNLSVTKTSS